MEIELMQIAFGAIAGGLVGTIGYIRAYQKVGGNIKMKDYFDILKFSKTVLVGAVVGALAPLGLSETVLELLDNPEVASSLGLGTLIGLSYITDSAINTIKPKVVKLYKEATIKKA